MRENFKRFISPNALQKELLCYSDAMGFDFQPDFQIDRQFYNDYLIMYTVSGVLICHQNGKKIAVKEGEYIFMNLHKPHKYYFQKDTPTKIAWLTLNGTPAAQIVQRMQNSFSMPLTKKDEDIYRDMLSFFELSDCPEPDIYRQSSDCYSLLMRIWRNADSENAAPSESRIRKEFKSEIWHIISHNLHRNISIDELAQSVSLSKFHFVRTFHTVFGTSPHRFIIAEKVRRAKYQLTNTSSTVYDIAYSLGFSNPAYFAKVFKEMTGFSPSEFRTKSSGRQL